MSLAVGEQVVNEHADNGEEEDDETPEDLVGNGTVGLEDLDPDEDVEHQNNESDDSTAGTVVPGLSRGRADIISDGSSKGERRKPELEERDDGVVKHVDRRC